MQHNLFMLRSSAKLSVARALLAWLHRHSLNNWKGLTSCTSNPKRERHLLSISQHNTTQMISIRWCLTRTRHDRQRTAYCIGCFVLFATRAPGLNQETHARRAKGRPWNVCFCGWDILKPTLVSHFNKTVFRRQLTRQTKQRQILNNRKTATRTSHRISLNKGVPKNNAHAIDENASKRRARHAHNFNDWARRRCERASWIEASKIKLHTRMGEVWGNGRALVRIKVHFDVH